MLSVVDLDRQFVVHPSGSDKPHEDLELRSLFGGAFGWPDLLGRRRVVILAEAGSGKSTEVEHQVKRLRDAGEETFFATFEDVGRKGGLRQALGTSGSARFEAWRASDQRAWLFLDSVDEAKKKLYRFARLLVDVADAIDGVSDRLHIVITGRHSDWEFQRDRQAFFDLLPVVFPQPPDIEPDTNQRVLEILRERKKPATTTVEVPLICRLASLDEERVERFARAKGVANVDAMFAALGRQNLWSFAGRPLDLDWLVAYWKRCGCFGSLAEMIKESLTERLKEPNAVHRRADNLSGAEGHTALERIGAALVLMRLDTIAVPDDTLVLDDRPPALSLTDFLQDIGPERCIELLQRPVFDPAADGFVRLHNDNEGAVRGYLAAQWLHHLRVLGNCPLSRVRTLLFADIHGERVVRPSMRATAAWLSVWDRDVALEVVARDPRLLMDAGDPGSLSLELRIKVLDALVERISGDELLDIPEHGALRRFARADLDAYVTHCWYQHEGSAPIRNILLLLVMHGEMHACAPLVLKAATTTYPDHYTQVFAGRAVASVCEPADQRRFVDYVLAEAATLPVVMLWDALESLFPSVIVYSEMLDLFDSARLRVDEGGLGVTFHGRQIVAKLIGQRTIADFTEALTTRFDAEQDLDAVASADDDQSLTEVLEAAATKLLTLCAFTEAPPIAIDAALRVGAANRFRPVRYPKREVTLQEHLRASPERRRSTIWRAAKRLRAQQLSKVEIIRPVHLQWAGIGLGLTTADLPWILTDMRTHEVADASLATELALCVWHEANRPKELLAQIEAAAENAGAASALAFWFAPSQRSSAEEESNRVRDEYRARNAAQQVKEDAEWIALFDSFRADPDQLRRLPPPTPQGIDRRLLHIWQLLRRAGPQTQRNAIRDIGPLQALLGNDVADAFRDACIACWRHLMPRLPSERAEHERRTVSASEMIGLVGVTQETIVDLAWIDRATPEEVRVATRLATFELNGFPPWLASLAQRHPNEVGDVLWTYVLSDLGNVPAGLHPDALRAVAASDETIVRLVAPRLLTHFEAAEPVQPLVADHGWRILFRGIADRQRVAALALERFRALAEPDRRALHLGVVFVDDPTRGTQALVEALDQLEWNDQVALSKSVLPALFGRHSRDGIANELPMPLAVIERLVRLAYAQIRPDDDNSHARGAYTPDDRDQAENARSMIFNRLVETPGLATYESLARLRAEPHFPVPDQRMRELMRERAERDAECKPWRAAAVREFELDFDTQPATSAELQRVCVVRLEEIEHRLLHGDFSLGQLVAGFESELAVQRWFGSELEQTGGRSYTLEREPHVASEKEPDIRLQSRLTRDAKMPIEIKIAESWSRKQLEEALTEQLQGRYLRDRDNRYGLLLLVHLRPRSRGWSKLGGGRMSFRELVLHLQALAHRIGAASSSAPMMVVCPIDVSTCLAAAS